MDAQGLPPPTPQEFLDVFGAPLVAALGIGGGSDVLPQTAVDSEQPSMCGGEVSEVQRSESRCTLAGSFVPRFGSLNLNPQGRRQEGVMCSSCAGRGRGTFHFLEKCLTNANGRILGGHWGEFAVGTSNQTKKLSLFLGPFHSLGRWPQWARNLRFELV